MKTEIQQLIRTAVVDPPVEPLADHPLDPKSSMGKILIKKRRSWNPYRWMVDFVEGRTDEDREMNIW